jgi:flagellar protein FliJ
MTRFQFRLQSMLRLAESQRDERRRELAAALEAVEVLRGRHETLDEEIQQIRQLRCAASLGENVRVEQLLDASRYELLLRSQLTEIENQQTQVDEELERRRLILVEANRHVQTLKKLRERKLAEHQLEEDRKQQRLLDEVAAQRYMRQAHREGSLREQTLRKGNAP